MQRGVIIYMILDICILFIVAYLCWKCFSDIESTVQCPGTVNPQLVYCDPSTSKPVSGQLIPESTCNPTSPSYTKSILVKLLEFFITTNEKNKKSLQSGGIKSWIQNTPQLRQSFHGIFYFANQDLLQVLPTDFGQNYSTPYGIVSLWTPYAACISNPSQFCESLFPAEDSNALTLQACTAYFVEQSKQFQNACPFPISDTSVSNTSPLPIADMSFFNQIGLLGAFSLTESQAVIVHGKLPVSQIGLNYWSMNMYMADSYRPSSPCQPFRNTFVASICPPCNLYTAVGTSFTKNKKKWDPLTGEGTVDPGNVTFCIIISTTQEVGNLCESSWNASLPNYDFVWRFNIPCNTNQMPIQSNLGNPNQLTTSDAIFNRDTDRLACFLRLSPDPNASEQEQAAFQNFVSNPSIYTIWTEWQISSITEYDKTPFPTLMPPMYNEVAPPFINTWKTQIREIHEQLAHSGFGVKTLPVRNSILNIFTPLNPQVLTTKIPYESGLQAIQMAGNAQADNHDAQYRLGKSICLGFKNVYMAIGVNHAVLGNAIYTSFNVLDTNRAQGLEAVNRTKTNPNTIYIVIASRNQLLLGILTQLLQQIFPHIDVFPIFLPTGVSQQNQIPMCHMIGMVERVYINPTYSSVMDNSIQYNIEELFPYTPSQSPSSVPSSSSNDDAWTSLTQVCGPNNSTLIPPVYYQLTYHPLSKQTIFILLLTFFLSCCLVIPLIIYIYRKFQS